MKTTLKAFTAISTILCALTSASAGPNMPNIKINMPNMAPAMRFAPPTIRTDLRTRSFTGDRTDGLLESVSPSSRRRWTQISFGGKPSIPQKPPLFAKVPPKKDIKAIAKAADAIRIPVAGWSDGPFGDPWPGETNSDPNGAQRMHDAQQRFGRAGTEPDWLGIAGRGLPSHNHHASTFPGLSMDLTRLPGVTATQGGTEPGNSESFTTQETDQHNGAIYTKTTYADGSVITSTDRSTESSRTSETIIYDNGQVIARSYGADKTTADGDHSEFSSQETTYGGQQWRSNRDTGGHPVHSATRGFSPRTVTGEEGGGELANWVPPSGWGAKGPRDNLDIGPGGRPTEEGTTVPGPQINMSRNLAVNPNPDVYAGSADSERSARSFDGGALVQPGNCQGTGTC